MAQFTHHVFVCCNQRAADHPRGCCNVDGAAELRKRFKEELARRGLTPAMRANEAGCLDQCEKGPVVVIYPQGIWYGGVTPDDVPRIVDETLLGGRVIDDLLIADEELNCKPLK